jgi:hypothetical protein
MRLAAGTLVGFVNAIETEKVGKRKIDPHTI